MHFILQSERYFVRFCSWLNEAGSIWIAILMVLIVGDIIGRVAFNHPVPGTPEIVKLSLVGIVFLQLAYVLSQGRHIRTTILCQRLSQNRQDLLNMLASVIGIVLFCLLLKSSWGLAVGAVTGNEYELAGHLNVPVAPTRILVVFGSTLMVIQFGFNLLRSLSSLLQLSKGDS